MRSARKKEKMMRTAIRTLSRILAVVGCCCLDRVWTYGCRRGWIDLHGSFLWFNMSNKRKLRWKRGRLKLKIPFGLLWTRLRFGWMRVKVCCKCWVVEVSDRSATIWTGHEHFPSMWRDTWINVTPKMDIQSLRIHKANSREHFSPVQAREISLKQKWYHQPQEHEGLGCSHRT